MVMKCSGDFRATNQTTPPQLVEDEIVERYSGGYVHTKEFSQLDQHFEVKKWRKTVACFKEEGTIRHGSL
jgi:hypothetical protein